LSSSFFHHCIVLSSPFFTTALSVHFRFMASECPFALLKFLLCLLLQYLLKHNNFVVSIVPHSCKFMVSTFRQVCRLICICICINIFTPVFSGVRVARALIFCVVFCTSLFLLLYFFICPLCCLYFFD
jgi:hypothetical protein